MSAIVWNLFYVIHELVTRLTIIVETNHLSDSNRFVDATVSIEDCTVHSWKRTVAPWQYRSVRFTDGGTVRKTDVRNVNEREHTINLTFNLALSPWVRAFHEPSTRYRCPVSVYASTIHVRPYHVTEMKRNKGVRDLKAGASRVAKFLVVNLQENINFMSLSFHVKVSSPILFIFPRLERPFDSYGRLSDEE